MSKKKLPQPVWDPTVTQHRTIERLAFYFTLDVEEGTECYDRVANLRRTSRPNEYRRSGIITTSFLLMPQDKSLDYQLYVDPVGEQLPGLRVGSFLTSAANGSSGRRPGPNWHTFCRIKFGLFYSRRWQRSNSPMEVIQDNMLYYLDEHKQLKRLGRPDSVTRFHVGLRMKQESFDRIKETILRIYEPPPQTLISKPGAPESQGSSARPPHPNELIWHVLPMGWWKSTIGASFQGSKTSRQADHVSLEQVERLTFLESLAPTAWYAGSHLGNRIYYVALFDKIAVADCPEWGNALYYCASEGERWRSTFRLTKAEALQAGAGRILHRLGWQEKLERLVKGERSRNH